MILKSPCFVTSNDLLVFNTLLDYKVIDDICGSAAIKAFTLRMWYLAEELVPLALFSSSLILAPSRKWLKN